ncbi:MAG: Maf family protein [Methylococcaceae bacterium]
MNTPRLILASASPRRSELLHQLGISGQVWPADLDERPHPGESPEAYVRRIAREKAEAVWALARNGLPVLAADTEVELDGIIFGKPKDKAHAVDMLTALSGREHRVLSSVGVFTGQGWSERLSISRVTFKPLTAAEIETYWASGEPAGKAGAYAIQGRGAVFIRHLSGSYSGVMGLPLFETAELLAERGLLQP